VNTEAWKLTQHNITHTTSVTIYSHGLKTITELEKPIMICQYIFAIQLLSQVYKHFSPQMYGTCHKYKGLSHWPILLTLLQSFFVLHSHSLHGHSEWILIQGTRHFKIPTDKTNSMLFHETQIIIKFV
jgi:hypothetical protein